MSPMMEITKPIASTKKRAEFDSPFRIMKVHTMDNDPATSHRERVSQRVTSADCLWGIAKFQNICLTNDNIYLHLMTNSSQYNQSFTIQSTFHNC